MKKFTNIITIIALILIIVLIGGVVYGYYKKATMEVKNPIVTMEVQDFGTIKLELYPEMAPQTVSNFIALAQHGFYDGLKFHRIIDGFMIQGGDANGDGSGSPKLSDLGLDVSGDNDKSYCIKGEFLSNGYNKNTLKHKEGVISMARADYTQTYSKSLTTESYNSAGSQFFIMVKDTPRINGEYAAFGRVLEGMDIVDQIVALETVVETDEETGETTETDTPVNKPVIESVTVETFGKDYGYPETVEPFDYMSYITSLYGGSLTTE